MIKDTAGLKVLAEAGRRAALSAVARTSATERMASLAVVPASTAAVEAEALLEGVDALLVGVTQLAKLVAELLQVGIGSREGGGGKGSSKGHAKRGGA